jgi:N-acetylated-alpha-linked acidic dipeptidase
MLLTVQADQALEPSGDPDTSSGAGPRHHVVGWLFRNRHWQFEFTSVDQLKRSAKAYDEALAKDAVGLSDARLARLQSLMFDIDQTLAPNVGLPGRAWYKNLIYAPGRFTGYGIKTLPGVREAIKDQRWADANRYAKLTADALNAYSDRLDKATAVLKGA